MIWRIVCVINICLSLLVIVLIALAVLPIGSAEHLEVEDLVSASLAMLAVGGLGSGSFGALSPLRSSKAFRILWVVSVVIGGSVSVFFTVSELNSWGSVSLYFIAILLWLMLNFFAQARLIYHSPIKE